MNFVTFRTDCKRPDSNFSKRIALNTKRRLTLPTDPPTVGTSKFFPPSVRTSTIDFFQNGDTLKIRSGYANPVRTLKVKFIILIIICVHILFVLKYLSIYVYIYNYRYLFRYISFFQTSNNTNCRYI